ncbi:MAG: helix-turn-helix domain-containing protein [Haloarculaceae archaeon]
MIAEFQFETAVADPVFGGPSAEAAEISALDATGEVPLCAALWVAENGAEADIQQALTEREVVRTTTEITAGQRGGLYRVRYGNEFDGTDVYRAAVAHGGVFVAGRAGGSTWTLRLQFPDRDAAGAFRDRCVAAGVDGSVDALYEREVPPRAARFRLTQPQRRALAVAARQGYFEVPRQTSLAGLAEELGVSSQAASERVRRGLDSLVEEALLPPTGDPLTQ